MYLLVIVTVIELEAIVALYNKSLEAISYVCFEHVQCTVYSWFKKGCRHQQSPVFNTLRAKFPFHSGWTQIQESCSWCNHLTAKIFAGAPCVQELLSYVWDPIYAGETHNFLQLIRSLYPTNLLLSFRNTLSLHRHFLTATLSFIDRGCYLEKQRKKRGGRRTGKGGWAGRKKTKQIARQQSLWNYRMPPN